MDQSLKVLGQFLSRVRAMKPFTRHSHDIHATLTRHSRDSSATPGPHQVESTQQDSGLTSHCTREQGFHTGIDISLTNDDD